MEENQDCISRSRVTAQCIEIKRMLLCVVCSTGRVTLVDTYQYDDSANDTFQREPYCVKFRLQDAGVPDHSF